MSPAPTSRSADLQRLVAEGFDVGIIANHLVLKDVPYVTSKGHVDRGVLVSTLALQADVTTVPDTHVVYFIGSEPCDASCRPLEGIINARGEVPLGPGLTAQFTFSSKPDTGYPDYYEKMTAYVTILEAEAQAVDPNADARTFPLVLYEDPESVFVYCDTASTRAGLGGVNQHLTGQRIGIVGLGGTGMHIFDHVAKTPVAEIHLFDGDRFNQHNAFRAPGAVTTEELAGHPSKVGFLTQRYGSMRTGIVPHEHMVTEDNLEELTALDFVFVAIDSDEAREFISKALKDAKVPFVDVGIGLDLRDDNRVGGLVRVTLSTPGHRVEIPIGGGGEAGLYDTNIQTGDLNMLNAALAIGAWKRCVGFYDDVGAETAIDYAVDTNSIIGGG